jgi:multidrug resistance efflux pump
LENRIQSAIQAEGDAKTNASVIAENALNTCQSVLVGINGITGFDENNSVVIPYDTYLGYYSQVRIDAKAQYKAAKAVLAEFPFLDFPNAQDRIQKTILLAEQVRDLADKVKELLDRHTVTGSILPLSSPTGASLTALQSAAAGYQSQINGSIAQLNGAKQALDNTALGNQTSLDALRKGYDMARQNLESLKATSGNQLDQAGFGQDQAENQVENLRIKLDSQVAAAKAQMDSARIQYENSLVGLNSLSGNYKIVAPIGGVVTRKLFSIGDTVVPGQLLMTVSRPDLAKVQFFVDQATLPYLKAGMPAQLRLLDGDAIAATLVSVSSRADEQSKRFMVEAEFAQGVRLALGTVADIALDLVYQSQGISHFMLPLSAIDVGQNGNRLTLALDGRAIKVDAEIVRIVGEAAEVSADLPADARIIVEGNRLAQEGDYLTISNSQFPISK